MCLPGHDKKKKSSVMYLFLRLVADAVALCQHQVLNVLLCADYCGRSQALALQSFQGSQGYGKLAAMWPPGFGSTACIGHRTKMV